MAKTQIWLRDDERSLVHRALLFVAQQAERQYSADGTIERFSLRFTRDSVREVAKHFEPKDPSP
jgi:hypothetical protein